MALSLSRPKDITPPKTTEGTPPSSSLSLASQASQVRLDAVALLSATLEQWRDEHMILFQRQLGERGVQSTVTSEDLRIQLKGHLPNIDQINTVLHLKRRVDISIVPHSGGDSAIDVHHEASGETLSFPCELRVSIKEKELSATEMSMLKQCFQTTLATRANAFFNRLVADKDGDDSTPRPVFIVAADTDLTRVLWTSSEVVQGFRVLRGSAAQAALSEAPEFTRPNARHVEASDYVVLLSPYLKVTPQYRSETLDIFQKAYRSHLPLTSRASSLFLPQHENEKHFLDMIDILLSMESSAQAAKDPSATEYQRRVGADADTIKERARLKKEAQEEAAHRNTALRSEVRSSFAILLEDEALPQNVKNMVLNTQTSVFAALAKGRLELVMSSLDDAIARLPEGARQPLESLKGRLTQ